MGWLSWTNRMVSCRRTQPFRTTLLSRTMLPYRTTRTLQRMRLPFQTKLTSETKWPYGTLRDHPWRKQE